MRGRSACLLLAALLLASFVLGGCGSQTAQKAAGGSKTTVTDMLGRQVSLAVPAERVVAIGPGALRLYCYVNGVNKVVGVEQIEKDNPTGRPYLLANPSLTNLPVIGPGGPNNAPDPEKILAVKPDVIFTAYNSDKAAVEELQAKTGVPVVALSYGKVSTFDLAVYSSLKLIGKIVGQEKKAQDLVDFMEKCKQDLAKRTKNIPDNKKPSVYVGALGARGTHGIESTQGKYSLFEAINARNVVDETGKTGSLMIEKEKLLQWNPDIIFIDLAGYPMVQQDYQKNPQFYKALSAVKKGELYSQLPYNYYTTNIGTAVADAYYLGKVIYPEQFKDVEPEKKADEIYQALLGKQLYAQMAKDFGGFKKLTLP
ncbi:MAG: iron ABC transporter substrate-binding protein [Peptococcaceae bacterium]|jgi:iron complex transport system substrate-binding protein|nr:iron ABC transporter substrate-binding protein [Peptococcaceae bacterium]MDH7525833.1 iron ABC transporter substrate-binding protein [Peptococcaceae bacterium]